MPLENIHYASIAEVAAAIQNGAVTSSELTELILNRIEHLEPRLGAHITVTADIARRQAARADAEIAAGTNRGLLHGVPFGVKDMFFTRNSPTSFGMHVHRDFVAGFDATAIRRLAGSGAVLVGKHVLPGGASGRNDEYPKPRSPWNENFTVGGSSSGSAVAVAAGLCYGALGSDTGGSLRYPSSLNGLTTVKPTWGRVSLHGVFHSSPSFDAIGPMARSAADAAVLLAAIAGDDENDPTTLVAPVPDYLGDLSCGADGLRGVRVGVDPHFVFDDVTADVASNLQAALAQFRDLGAHIVELVFPDRSGISDKSALEAIEAAVAHEATYGAKKSLYGKALAEVIEQGRAMDPVHVARCYIERDRFRGRCIHLFKAVDMLALPTIPIGDLFIGALEGLDITHFFRFTYPLAIAGLPVITIPCGTSPGGVPFGLQLAGPPLSEAALLKAAHAYQQVTDWHARHPSVD